jgi:hypothetical protein
VVPLRRRSLRRLFHRPRVAQRAIATLTNLQTPEAGAWTLDAASPSGAAGSKSRRHHLAPAPATKRKPSSVAAALPVLVHLKSVVVAGKRFCCDAEQHSPPASVRVADQPRADDDATSLSTPVNCPLGEGSCTATGRLRCSPPNVVRPLRIGFSTQIALRRGTSPIDRAARVRVAVGRPDLRSRWSIDFKEAGGREAVREYLLEGVYYCRVELRAGAAF